MKRIFWFAIVILSILVVLAVLYWQNLHEDAAESLPQTALTQSINQCDLIAGKAAANLPEALPFQKLEKAARQSRVLERCMQDQGYGENPAWGEGARVKAAHAAKAQQISAEEAYETLRRAAMLQAENAGKVSYWRKRS